MTNNPMTTRPAARAVFAATGGLGVLIALTACSTGSATDTTDDASSGSSAAPSASASTDSGTTGDYTDGTYSADGSYSTPGGQESVGVTLTIADGIVTDVAIEEEGQSPNSKQYQAQFASGIADVVVGVPLDELDVDRVAGSSLTSEGFNAAVETIKADAAA